jgi:hypothetical protein
MIAVGVLSQEFRAVSGGADGAAAIFEFATNPIVGLLLGVLATALVQSSSALTSVIVGLVGGGLPVAIAIPMIMGSNTGTTVTNTIASLGSLREDKAFNRSFSAATVHDFFNLFTIVIVLLYNGFGLALFAAMPPLWRLPIRAAQALADGAERSRWVVPAYMLRVFFVLPGLVCSAQVLFDKRSPEVLEAAAEEEVYAAVKKEIEDERVEIE